MLNVDKIKSKYAVAKIDIGYSYLAEPSYIDNYKFQDYKIGGFLFSIISSKTRKPEISKV
jgi:hypothetical protein